MINDEYIPFTIGRQKHIALIAHDSKKQELVEWVDANKDILKGISCAERHYGAPCRGQDRASRQGLQQRPAWRGPAGKLRIVEGAIDFVVFFWDPLESQPHDLDVRRFFGSQSFTTFLLRRTRPRPTS